MARVTKHAVRLPMKVLVVLLPADGRVPFVTCDAWPITADFRTPLAASQQRTRGAMVYINDPIAVVSAAPKVSFQNRGSKSHPVAWPTTHRHAAR